MKYIQIVAVLLLLVQAAIIPVHIVRVSSPDSALSVITDAPVNDSSADQNRGTEFQGGVVVGNSLCGITPDIATEPAYPMPEGADHKALNNEVPPDIDDNSSGRAASREKNITLRLTWIRSALSLSEADNERLMNDFSFIPGLSLTDEENEKLMWDFNTLPEIGFSDEENERLMQAFNLLPEPLPKKEVPHTESVWDIDRTSDTALRDEENEKLMQDFNTMPGCVFYSRTVNAPSLCGLIEGYVYFRKPDGEILPARDIRVDAWSEELDAGNEALTDETGRYQISGLREVSIDEAENKGYLVETRLSESLYQFYDQVDDAKDAARIETGRTDIDFYLETGEFEI